MVNNSYLCKMKNRIEHSGRVERIDGKRTFCVDGRGYHLFKTWFGARKLWKEITRAQDAKIVMAVVPRGTYYISGDYDGCRSVVVKKVKY